MYATQFSRNLFHVECIEYPWIKNFFLKTKDNESFLARSIDETLYPIIKFLTCRLFVTDSTSERANIGSTMKIFVNKFWISIDILKSAFLILYNWLPSKGDCFPFNSFAVITIPAFFDLFSLRIYLPNRKSRNYPLNCLHCAIRVYLGQTNEIVYIPLVN